jgi:thioester reductase-like protein
LRGATTVSERGKTQEVSWELHRLTEAILGRPVGVDDPLSLDSLRRIEFVAGIDGELGICLPSDALSDVATLRDLDRVVGATGPDAVASVAELVARFPAPHTAPRAPTNMHSAPARPPGAAKGGEETASGVAPVFLTGATGLLGAHLARALGRARVPLRVLVRARTDHEAHARLEELGIVATPVLGDLADHALLAAEAAAASMVVHLAASLRIDANMDALYTENVAPLAPLLASGTKLVFASSLAVLAFSTLVGGGMSLDPTHSVEDAGIFGGYAQSKALGEAWCAGHPQAHVIRIGLVVADDKDLPSGRCPLRALTAALHLLGMRPSGHFLGAAFDAVPLGAVVEALLACVHPAQDAPPKAVYAATPATVDDLYAAFEAAGRPLTIVPPEEFRNAIYRSPLLPLERRAALELLRVSDRDSALNIDSNILFRLTARRFDPSFGVPNDPRQTLLRLVTAVA